MSGCAQDGMVHGGAEGRSALPLVVAVVLVALVAVFFLPSLGNEFLPDWDDGYYLSDNPIVRGGLTLEGVQRAFAQRHGANWIPVTWISHMIDVSLSGLVPWKHRLVNVALHAANAVLVFTLLRFATGALWPSALAAALFAVHPLRVESVVWVAERKDVLSACFGLLCLLAYLRWAARRRPGRYVAVACLFALSLMAKPMLVTLPALLLVLDWWPLGRIDARTWRERILEKVPLILAAVAVAAVTLLTQSRGGAMRAVPPLERLMNVLVAYAGYLRLTLLPAELSPLYPAVRGGPGMGAVLVSLGVLLLISVGVVRARWSHPYVGFGWLWYLVALLPVIGIVPVGAPVMADRYTYLPLLGPVAALVWTLHGLAVRRNRPITSFAVTACLVVGVLGGLTVRQSGIWRDELTLFLRAQELLPPSAEVEHDLAAFQRRSGDLAAAELHYRRAIALDPEKAESLVNLGELLFSRGERREAAELYRAAIERRPRLASAWNNLGAALEAEGRREEALSNYRRAVELAPEYLEARLNLGSLLAATGQEDDAGQQFERAVRIDPASALAHYQLGIALARRGAFAGAVGELSAAATQAPEDGQILEALKAAQTRLRGGPERGR